MGVVGGSKRLLGRTGECLGMVRCLLNHVALDVDDLDDAVAFYTEVFDMTPVPTPPLGDGYAWLQFSDQQLHLIERDAPKPPNQHFALIVDEFTKVWDRLVDRGAIVPEEIYIRALPNGVIQCYLTDPSDNRLEIMWHDVTTLPERIQQYVEHTAVDSPTGDEPAGATIAPNVRAFVD